MNKYEVEKLVPIAICVCENNKSTDAKSRNKISAFGATVIMSGLRPAVAAFQKDEKKIVIDLMKAMASKTGDDKLLERILQEDSSNDQYKKDTEKILNYVVSLKLALDAAAGRESS